MNPGYFRIRLPRDAALDRFVAWQGLGRAGPLVATDAVAAVGLACDEQGNWRGRAVFVAECPGWTVFSDLSGQLGGIPGEEWLAFAGADELVVAGYNDAIGFGEFVLVRDGRVQRAFLDDAGDAASRVDLGASDVAGEPFADWVGVAAFVDDDALGFAEQGWLWMW